MFGIVVRLYREIGTLSDRELWRIARTSTLSLCVLLFAWLCLLSAKSGAFDAFSRSWALLVSGSLGGFVGSLFEGDFPASSGTLLFSLAGIQACCYDLVSNAVTEALDAHADARRRAGEGEQ